MFSPPTPSTTRPVSQGLCTGPLSHSESVPSHELAPTHCGASLGGEIVNVARGCQHGLVGGDIARVGPVPIGHEREHFAGRHGTRYSSPPPTKISLATAIPSSRLDMAGYLRTFHSYQHPRRPVYGLSHAPRVFRGWQPLGPDTYALAEGGRPAELWVAGQLCAFRTWPDADPRCPLTLIEVKLLSGGDAAEHQRVHAQLIGRAVAGPPHEYATVISHAPFGPVQRSVVRVDPAGRARRELTIAQPGDFKIGDWVMVECYGVRSVCPGRGQYRGLLGLRMSVVARDGDIIPGTFRLPGIADQVE